MIYPITPTPKPRMTRRDKWAKRPAVMRYRAFADECRARGVTLPPDWPVVVYTLPMPKSWSKRKRSEMLGQPHKQKPDLDNLDKALADALYADDSHIHRLASMKVWGETGSIEIHEWQWGMPWPNEENHEWDRQ